MNIAEILTALSYDVNQPYNNMMLINHITT